MKQHQIVREQREAKQQSQKQVHTAIGMPQQTYSSKEAGLFKFKPRELELIAKHLDIDVSVFYPKPPATPPTTEPKAELNVIEALAVMQNSQLALWQRVDKLERERAEEKKKAAEKEEKRKKK